MGYTLRNKSLKLSIQRLRLSPELNKQK